MATTKNQPTKKASAKKAPTSKTLNLKSFAKISSKILSQNRHKKAPAKSAVVKILTLEQELKEKTEQLYVVSREFNKLHNQYPV